MDFIAAYFKDPVQAGIPCVVSQDRIYVDPYGNVFGGCLSMGQFGNLKNTSFGILKKDAGYKRARKNMFYKKCKGCSCGYMFNVRYAPGLILKDIIVKIRNTLKG